MNMLHQTLQQPAEKPLPTPIERWVSAETDLADIPDRLRTLAQYWLATRGDDDIPSRHKFDPSAVKSILPNLMMLGLERMDGKLAAVRIRLMGTALVRAYGRDWTGQTSQECDRPEHLDSHLQRMQNILENRRPLYWRQWSLARGCEDLFAERLFCPLAGEDGSVTRIVMIIEFPGMEHDPRVREGFGPLLLGNTSAA
jgi:hypothetical protein